MKTAIVGILNNPATSMNSHSAGMVNIVASVFNADILTEREDWNQYDSLIIYHGVNFKKGFYNVIGGINDNVMERSDKLYNYKKNGLVYTLDGFQLNDFSKKRGLKKYDNHVDIDPISLPRKDKVIIGDSHSISVWESTEYSINRMDGKTLFGFLKNPIIADHYYFGNIDVRFHLARQADPIKATKDLVKKYIDHAKINNATVTCLLPIENDNRKIPGTGLYKGKPFYGSNETRKMLVSIFNNELMSSGLKVTEWPIEWYDNIEFYQKEVMEPKQSVHIRPKYYQKQLKNENK
jgi:hypothetical protein